MTDFATDFASDNASDMARASAASSPETILGSNLKLDLWADTLAAGAVASWADLSGNANTGTSAGAAQPTCTSNEVNGHNAVVFGASKALGMTNGFAGVLAGDRAWIAAVIKSTAPGSVLFEIGPASPSTNTNTVYYYSDNGSSLGTVVKHAADGCFNATATIATYKLVILRYDGTNFVEMVNNSNVNQTAGTGGLPSTITQYNLGGTIGASGSIVSVARLCVCKATPSTTDEAAFVELMRSMYALF